MKGIAYLRVSTDEQDLGLDAQRAAVASWCAREGVELAGEHVDDGVGGASPLDRRPGLLAAIEGLRRGRVLVVAKRDRLARDPFVAMLVEKEARKRGARVVCADGSCNGDEAGDVLMRRMLDAFAEFERAQIALRTRAALAVKRRRGERISGRPPFGWRFGEGGSLEAVASEQEQLERARRLRREGSSAAAIASALGSNPRTGRPWDRVALWKVLRTAARRAS